MPIETTNQSRRKLLKGRISSASELRPPWAQLTGQFESLCSRCSACIKQCPQNIINKGDGGFPVIDFSAGECIFCADCVASCETGALLKSPEKPPWQYRAGINEHCLCSSGVQCMSCRDECYRDAIGFKPTSRGLFVPVVDPNTCNGCGACIAVCPAKAISISDQNHRDDRKPD